ncbi:MAG: type IX secretion system PorP/SprF family membrane protein [Vicingaceae bacterium]|jgi:type IX secretion system PorP/SprF family membrane protein
MKILGLKIDCFLLLIIVFTINKSGYAQDPQFSQFYANPMYLNPALTGNTAQLRMASTYRNQWPSIPQGYVSYTAAFEYNLDKAKSGIGILATHDKAGNQGLKYTNIALLYSSHIRLSRSTFLKGGAKFSYTTRGVNQSELLFSDQIIRDGAPFSIEQIGNSINNFDFGAGILLSNDKRYWVGLSIDHVNQPKYSFLGTNSFLGIKTSVHGGYTFELNKSDKVGQPTYIKAVVHYKSQDKWDQLDIGAYYENNPFYLGLWYRGIPFKRFENEYQNNESFVFLLGVQANDLRIGYSYDATISKLARYSGGAHEISIIYEIANDKRKRKNKRYFLAPCPKF